MAEKTKLDAMLHQTPDEQFRAMKDVALKGIKDHFPFQGQKHRLELNKVWADEEKGDQADDLDGLKNKRLTDRTWGVPIYGDLSVKDARSGRELSRTRKMRLAVLPRPTPHYSYLVNGTEFQPVTQPRLRSGVYSRVAADGTPEAAANLRKGKNFKVTLRQDTGQFMLSSSGQKSGSTINVPLYAVARAMGATDRDLQKAWGSSCSTRTRPRPKISTPMCKSSTRALSVMAISSAQTKQMSAPRRCANTTAPPRWTPM